MRMETEYLLEAKNEEDINRVAQYWGEVYSIENNAFEGFETEIFQVMEKTIKTVHCMETKEDKIPFRILGKCDTDYDCTIFQIEYEGEEPQIKSSQGDPDENEKKYCTLLDARYDDIPKLLKRNKNRSFKQAIEDDIPLGGFLDVPYEEWYASVLNVE